MLSLLLLLACEPEPVLRGVSIDLDADDELGGAYQKPEHVVVDIGWLAGRSWDLSRDVVSQQLGDIQEVKTLDPRDGQEYVLERGFVRVKDGTIYLIHVKLERPMRREVALHQLNILAQVDQWHAFSDEWRTRWHDGFERIRVGREVRDAPLAVWVEVLKEDPRSAR